MLNTPRELSSANIITCIEVIEHVADYTTVINSIKRFMDNETTLFISTPNRNSDLLQKDTPKNIHHVREWSASEFYDVLIKHFQSVTLYNHDLSKDVDLDTKETPLVAKCIGVIGLKKGR